MTPPFADPPRWGADAGASEVVGSILMVALTVALAVAMISIVWGAVPSGEDSLRASFSASIQANDAGWGSGDETVRVDHEGGNAVPSASLAIVVAVDGDETRFTADGSDPLDHGSQDAFTSDDPAFVIGERWHTPDMTIPPDARVAVSTVDTSAEKTLWTGSFRAGTNTCSADTEPPTVTGWSQSPADVTTDTTGAVAVEATLSDNCGVDTTQDPHLHYRVNDGSDPTFTDAGPMDLQTDTTWRGEIPDQRWNTRGGDTLEYKLVDMTDENGNTGESTVQQDLVEDTGGSTTTPVTTFTVAEGTASSDPEAAAASDDGDEATFTEEGTSSPTSFTLDADGFRDPSDTWDDETDGFVSDDQYATTTATNPVRYRMSSPSPISTVTSVVLRAEVSVAGHINDAFTMAACFPSGDCGDASPQQGGSETDTTMEWDVTSPSEHPLGNSSWTESDLEVLELRITPVQNPGGAGPPTDGTWRVDRAWTSVSGSTTTYSLAVQGDFANVPAGTHSLEMEYRVVGDAYDVQVWDWTNGVWNTRGATLDQTTATTWSYTLTADEHDGVDDRVRMRYLDRTDGSTQGELHVDYLWVVTS